MPTFKINLIDSDFRNIEMQVEESASLTSPAHDALGGA